MSRSGNFGIRLGVIALLILATLFIPWWGTVALIAMYAVLFQWFLEGVLIGWLIDSAFAPELPWITISVLIYILVVEVVAYYVSH
jgi:hypothetical protein